MDRLDIKRIQIANGISAGNDSATQSLSVLNVMTMAPRTVAAETPVLDLVRLLKTNRFRHLLVCDQEEQLIGVLSDRDVVRCFGPNRYPDEERLRRITASEIMSEDVITVGPGAPILTAVRIIIEHGISCLPVVVDRKAIGILTNTDLHLLLEQLLTAGTARVSDSALLSR